MLNNALFRVEDVQDKNKKKEKEKNVILRKPQPAKLGLARACAKIVVFSTSLQVVLDHARASAIS